MKLEPKLTSNRKQTSKGDVHIDTLKRAEKLSESGSKVFDKNSLKVNEEYLLKEDKLLGLSHDDIHEIETVSRAASEGPNLSDQIKAIELNLEGYVEQQKRFIQFIESTRKELMELTYRDRIELDSVHSDWVRERAKAYYKILYKITSNMITESTLANQMIAVNAKLQVSKKQHPLPD
jgi:hypothetical protein